MCVPRLRLSDGGVVQAVLDLATNLASENVDLVLLPVAMDASISLSPKVQVEFCEELGLLQRLSLHTKELIEGCDVVHCHTVWSVRDRKIAAFATSSGKPVVLSLHGMADDWPMSHKPFKKRIYRKTFGRKFLKSLTLFHACAESEADQASRNLEIDRNRFRVVPLYVPAGDEKQEAGPERGKTVVSGTSLKSCSSRSLRVLFLGRLHPVKGIEKLIDAIALLEHKGVPVELFIAGSGRPSYEKSLRKLAKTRHLDSVVHFLGMVCGAEKRALFDMCDVYASPTLQENFGLATIEAMRVGLVTLTTRQSDIWQELEAMGAIICDATAEAFAEQLERLADDQILRGARPNVAAITEWLSPEALTAKYMSLYKECLEKCVKFS